LLVKYRAERTKYGLQAKAGLYALRVQCHSTS
jgi:hypothetical protein